MLSYYHLLDGKMARQEEPESGHSLWVRSEAPSADDLFVLHQTGLDDDIVTDALDPHEVPRIEHEGDWTYFITRLPGIDDNYNDFTTPIMFALGNQQVVTLSRERLGRLWQPFIDRARLPVQSQTQLFLSMIEALLRSYQTRVALINRQTRAVTSDVTTLRSRDIATLVEFERKLNDYLDALIPTNVALERTLNRRYNLISLGEEDQDMVEDLSVDIEQLIARCKSLLRTIQNVRDSFRAVMDTRLNETMRILTVATLALTIPTMLAGLFGMNVDFPFDTQGVAAFWTIVVGSVVAAAATAYYFLKNR